MRRIAGFRLLGLACLCLAFLLAAGSAPASAQDARWLPFDPAAQPAGPALSVLHADGKAVELRAGLPGGYVEDIRVEGQAYSRLYGAGYGQPGTAGLPALPVLRRDVEIPFSATATVEIVAAEYADYSLAELGLSPIYPLQPSVRKLPGERENQPFVIDRDFYARGSQYPAAPLALGEQYVVRGHRIQTVEVWPVAYNPAAGTIRLYSSVTFRLRLRGSDLGQTRALADRYASPAYETRLSATILNYNQGRPAATFAPNAAIGYLIVVADAYYDALQPFVQLKESRGFDVTTVKTSEIPGGATNTNIKAYIQAAYDTWPLPPSYVLFVGDTNTVPTWTGPTIGTSTDLYYGTMDGSADWHPDMGRGRFPVRSPAQTTIMVDKYVLYGGLTGQEEWIKQAAFPATCDNYTVAEATHNYVINTHTAPDGFFGHFPNDPQPGGDKLYCVTYNATQADVIEAANDGRWAIIYSGHGSYSGWELLDQGNVPNLTNYGMPSFVASHACLSGDFGETEVFGETWVLQPNKGALVYWGSSTYSYWDEDDWLERAMFDSLFSDPYGHARITEMTDYGLADVEAHNPSMARYYWETYNVLGDPAAKLFLVPDLPTFSLTIDPMEHEVCQSGEVTSTVTIASVQGYSQTVYLEAGALPDGITVTFDPASAPAPFESVMTLGVAAGTPEGEYTIEVTATDHVSYTQNSAVTLKVTAGEPQAPELLSPADGAVDQPFVPSFEWNALPNASTYRFQLDRSPLFGAPLADEAGLIVPGYTAGTPLAGGLCYWWRAAGDNSCGEGEWADPFHFSTVALDTVFYDNMEAGAGQWTHQAAQGVDHWILATDQSHSPTHAWFVPDDDTITDTRLWNTAPVAVGAGSSLTFWHRYAFEGTGYDGSVLEVSTDDGQNWADLGPYITANGYNGTISTGWSNPLGGREAWVSTLLEWTKVEVDLSSFAGQEVQVRWRLGCDVSVGSTGWYIDDVEITAPMPPNPAPELTSITPDYGSAYAATPVTVQGAHFVDAPSLRLGETWLMSVTLISSATIEAVVPAGMEAGTYALTLYNGDCQEATLPDAFTVTTECVAPSVTATSDSPVEAGEPMHFHAVATGSPPMTYTWNFGGEGQGTGLDTPTPVFTYTLPGEYTVVVTVANECGEDAAELLVQALVPCEEPEARVASDSPVHLGEPMHFTALVSGTLPMSYTWSFGGEGQGADLDTPTPVFTYTAPGTYTATVAANNECGEDTAALAVEVLVPCDEPEAAVTSDSPVYLGEPLHLTAVVTGTAPITLTWDFGGEGVGSGLDGPTPVFTYTLPGTYLVTVLAENGCGSLQTEGLEVRVLPKYYIYLPILLRAP